MSADSSYLFGAHELDEKINSSMGRTTQIINKYPIKSQHSGTDIHSSPKSMNNPTFQKNQASEDEKDYLYKGVSPASSRINSGSSVRSTAGSTTREVDRPLAIPSSNYLDRLNNQLNALSVTSARRQSFSASEEYHRLIQDIVASEKYKHMQNFNQSLAKKNLHGSSEKTDVNGSNPTVKEPQQSHQETLESFQKRSFLLNYNRSTFDPSHIQYHSDNVSTIGPPTGQRYRNLSRNNGAHSAAYAITNEGGNLFRGNYRGDLMRTSPLVNQPYQHHISVSQRKLNSPIRQRPASTPINGQDKIPSPISKHYIKDEAQNDFRPTGVNSDEGQLQQQEQNHQQQAQLSSNAGDKAFKPNSYAALARYRTRRYTPTKNY